MKNTITFLLLILMACNPPQATKTSCADGSSCVAIDCTSPNYSHADCVIAFGHACPAGYDILDDRSGSYLIRCHEAKPKW
jgi:hypothetical protein